MRSRLVLWGARAGDVQVGGGEDHRRQREDERFAAVSASMTRNAARIFAAMPTACEAAVNMRSYAEALSAQSMARFVEGLAEVRPTRGP